MVLTGLCASDQRVGAAPAVTWFTLICSRGDRGGGEREREEDGGGRCCTSTHFHFLSLSSSVCQPSLSHLHAGTHIRPSTVPFYCRDLARHRYKTRFLGRRVKAGATPRGRCPPRGFCRRKSRTGHGVRQKKRQSGTLSDKEDKHAQLGWRPATVSSAKASTVEAEEEAVRTSVTVNNENTGTFI